MFTKYKIDSLKNKWFVLFIASFVSIQLVEFFIWRNINNAFYNNVFSIIAAIVIAIQPIISLMILTDIELRNTLLMIYIMAMGPYSIYKFSTEHIHSVKSENGHLMWGKPSTIACVFWLFFFLFSFAYERFFGIFIFGILTLLISFLNYKNGNTVGSMWCWVVNSLMIYYAAYLLLYLPFLEKSQIC